MEKDQHVGEFKCAQCDKICKSQRGLTRHVNVKHFVKNSDDAANASDLGTTASVDSEEISMRKFHSLHLKVIVLKCAGKLSEDKSYRDTRVNFSKENFQFSNKDAYELWKKLRPVIDDFNGGAERFYSKFYSLLVDKCFSNTHKCTRQRRSIKRFKMFFCVVN